jgi:subtilisin family serine protease
VIIRPIFIEKRSERIQTPAATPDELADAIVECVREGARIINLSVALTGGFIRLPARLQDSLDEALHRGVVIVAAAGNQGSIGSSSISRHPVVIPVAGCDSSGNPILTSNTGHSIRKRGVSAPADRVTSINATGGLLTWSGTSVAAPLVTGAVALLWSEYPTATTAEIMACVAPQSARRSATGIPPMLDAWKAFTALRALKGVHAQTRRG